MTQLDYSTDVARGAWIEPRLTTVGSVAGTVPHGFARYLRIFHPLSVEDGLDSSWRACCERQATIWHPLMQWGSISGTERDTHEPWVGSLAEDLWVELARALAAPDGSPTPITAGLWEGFGFIGAPGRWPGSAGVSSIDAGSLSLAEATARRAITDFGTDVLAGPLLALPGRHYVLFTGELSTLEQPDWRRRSGWATLWPETVNLVWPDDRSWCVASEIDFDSTLVGCASATAARLLASGLEVAEVEPGGSMMFTADRLNSRP